MYPVEFRAKVAAEFPDDDVLQHMAELGSSALLDALTERLDRAEGEAHYRIQRLWAECILILDRVLNKEGA
jgi:hypothetical protein